MENLFKLNTDENVPEVNTNYDKILLEPYHHLNDIKGKGFRDVLIQVYNHWTKLDQDEVDLITDIFQFLHTVSLLGDDIQDSSELRRGNPAAHIIYGAGRTLAAMDFTISYLVLSKMEENPKFQTFTLLEVEKLLQGQIMEIYWRDNFICPSEEEYFDMASKKTGQIFASISNYMELYSKTKVNLKKLTTLLGIFFQLADDYRGLKSKSHNEKKGFCDDIREGKFIFPIVHAINSRPNDKRIFDILKMHTNDDHLKMTCLELLEEFGSMEYTRNKIIYFKNLILEELEHFERNDAFKILFELQNHDQ